jgi:ABC-2 type transport system ATP-binding protein
MISVKGVSKKYGNFYALNDVSLEIQKGEIVALLGPNGAGKTTLMKIITCYMPPTSGLVSVADQATNSDTVNIRKKIGYLPENAPLYNELNIIEYLGFVADAHLIPQSNKLESIEKVMVSCDLTGKARQNIGELSKGYRQRVGLAAALIHDPEILILDEPTSGLDPNQIAEIRNLIKNIKKEKTVLLSTHIMQEVEALCDRIIVLNEGRIIASGTENDLHGLIREKTYVTVQIEGSSAGVPTLLQQISGVEEVVVDRSGNRITDIRIRVSGDIDIRREVIDMLTSNKYGLIGIDRQTASLEEVFTELTRKTEKNN